MQAPIRIIRDDQETRCQSAFSIPCATKLLLRRGGQANDPLRINTIAAHGSRCKFFFSCTPPFKYLEIKLIVSVDTHAICHGRAVYFQLKNASI